MVWPGEKNEPKKKKRVDFFLFYEQSFMSNLFSFIHFFTFTAFQSVTRST